jgi:glyoxylase-like metal-dependent hydrolase (beta-lactamase superfamily II)
MRFIEGFEPIQLPAELVPFGSGWALPGSQREVLLVELPGHAAGHIGAFVLTHQGWTLLAADAAWATQNFSERRPPSRLTHLIMEDPRSYHQTLDRLQQLHAKGRVTIQLTHESAPAEAAGSATGPVDAQQATRSEATPC